MSCLPEDINELFFLYQGLVQKENRSENEQYLFQEVQEKWSEYTLKRIYLLVNLFVSLKVKDITKEDKEELRQDIGLDILKDISKIKRNFKGWLVTATKRKIIKYQKKRIKIFLLRLNLDESLLKKFYLPKNDLFELSEIIENLFPMLSPMEKKVIYWRYLQEKTLEEVAEILETTVSSVKSQLAKAKRKLREDKDLKDYYYEN